MSRFIEEARTLARFKHPNLVRVLSVFEANNTAYMVMKYERGQSLQAQLADRGTVDETGLLRIVLPLLSGLQQVHAAGFIHRDIKPDNIFIREDGSPLLLDFGSARQASRQRSTTLTSLVSPGYAPFEQYYSKSDEQGPWTDIYGLAATMYRAICGRAPTDAVDRSRTILESNQDYLVSATELGRGTYSEHLLQAIDHGLAFRASDRPQDIASWQQDFDVEAHLLQVRHIQTNRQAPTVIAHRTDGDRSQAARASTTAPPPTAPASHGRTQRVGWIVAALAIAGATVLFALDLAPFTRSTAPAPAMPALPTPTPEAAPALAPDLAPDLASAQKTAPAQSVSALAAPTMTRATPAVSEMGEKVSALLRLAELQRQAGAVLSPPGGNALGSLREALRLDAGNDLVRNAIQSIYTDLLTAADRALRVGDPDAAQVSTDYAATINPDGQELALMQITLRDARRQQDLQDAQQQQTERVAAAQAKAQADAEALRQAQAKAAQQQQRTLAAAQADADALRQAQAKAEAADRQRAQTAQRAVIEDRERRAAERSAGEARERASAQQAALAGQQARALERCTARKATVYAEPKRAQGDTVYFAALAVGRNNSWGEASGYANRQQAEEAALSNCHEHGKNCKVQAWSNDCVALARDTGKAAGWAWGESRAEAARKAIRFCEEHSAYCSVTTAYCADEVQ